MKIKLTRIHFSFFIFSQLAFSILGQAKELRIYAKPGQVYNLSPDVKDINIIIVGSGTVDLPFVFNGNNVRLEGKSSIFCVASNVIIENVNFHNVTLKPSQEAIIRIGQKKAFANGVTVRDCKFSFTGSFIDQGKGTQFFWLKLNGNKLQVENCSFSGKRNRLPIIHVESGGMGNAIMNSLFENVKPRKGEALEAIRVGLGDGNSNLIIKGNTFINYHGDSETISIKANGATIVGNIFKDCRSGISVRLGDFARIANNKFYNTVWPIRLSGIGHIVENNIFDDKCRSALTFMIGGRNYKPSDQIMVRGNIFYKEMTIMTLETQGNDIQPKNITIYNNFIKFNRVMSVADITLNLLSFGKPDKLTRRSDNVLERKYIFKGSRLSNNSEVTKKTAEFEKLK